jgi:hypothetical protein
MLTDPFLTFSRVPVSLKIQHIFTYIAMMPTTYIGTHVCKLEVLGKIREIMLRM